MFLLDTSIKSIIISESVFHFENSIRKSSLKVDTNELKKIYVKSNKNKGLYFFNFFSLIMCAGVVFSGLYLSISSLIVSLALLFSWTWYLMNYRFWSIFIMLNNGVNYKFYFSNKNKYEFIEKIKIIRGKMNDHFFIENRER